MTAKNQTDDTTEAKLTELPDEDDVTTMVKEFDVDEHEEHNAEYAIHYNLEDSDAAIIETFTFYTEGSEDRIFLDFAAYGESAAPIEEQRMELDDNLEDVVTRDDDATPRNFIEAQRNAADLTTIWEPVTKGY